MRPPLFPLSWIEICAIVLPGLGYVAQEAWRSRKHQLPRVVWEIVILAGLSWSMAGVSSVFAYRTISAAVSITKQRRQMQQQQPPQPMPPTPLDAKPELRHAPPALRDASRSCSPRAFGSLAQVRALLAGPSLQCDAPRSEAACASHISGTNLPRWISSTRQSMPSLGLGQPLSLEVFIRTGLPGEGFAVDQKGETK